MPDSSPYDVVASEYYDSGKHPTCANLHDATRFGIMSIRDVFVGFGEAFCEVGAGKSMLGDLAPTLGQRIVSLDLNWNMLIRSSGLKVLGDATDLPFADASFHGVFGSLADPYNVERFYQESHRVLRPDGRLMFSVPSVDWVRANQAREGLADSGAVFRMEDGAHVHLPSFVYSHAEQHALLERAGFADIVRRPVTWNECSGITPSPRFRDAHGKLISPVVVDIYVARRTPS